MSKSIDDLVAGLPESKSGTCWAAQLDGDAALFVVKVKAREAALGKPLHRGTIISTLKSTFNIVIGEEAVRKHLSGRCRCD
jgi:hypothetical protein